MAVEILVGLEVDNIDEVRRLSDELERLERIAETAAAPISRVERELQTVGRATTGLRNIRAVFKQTADSATALRAALAAGDTAKAAANVTRYAAAVRRLSTHLGIARRQVGAGIGDSADFRNVARAVNDLRGEVAGLGGSFGTVRRALGGTADDAGDLARNADKAADQLERVNRAGREGRRIDVSRPPGSPRPGSQQQPRPRRRPAVQDEAARQAVRDERAQEATVRRLNKQLDSLQSSVETQLPRGLDRQIERLSRVLESSAKARARLQGQGAAGFFQRQRLRGLERGAQRQQRRLGGFDSEGLTSQISSIREGAGRGQSNDDLQESVRGVQARLNRFRRESVEGTTDSVGKLRAAMARAGASGERSFRRIGRSARPARRGVDGMTTAFRRLHRAYLVIVTGVGLEHLVGSFARISDSVTNLRNLLGAVGEGIGRVGEHMSAVRDIALDTFTPLEGAGVLYARLLRANDRLGFSMMQLGDLTKAFQQSLVLSGADSRETLAASVQFSQALSSGRLAGDEFKSLSESAPVFLQALRDAYNEINRTDISLQDFRDLGAEGKLTSEVLVNLGLRVVPRLNKQFATFGRTYQHAFTTVNTGFVFFLSTLGDAFDRLTGIKNVLIEIGRSATERFGPGGEGFDVSTVDISATVLRGQALLGDFVNRVLDRFVVFLGGIDLGAVLDLGADFAKNSAAGAAGFVKQMFDALLIVITQIDPGDIFDFFGSINDAITEALSPFSSVAADGGSLHDLIGFAILRIGEIWVALWVGARTILLTVAAHIAASIASSLAAIIQPIIVPLRNAWDGILQVLEDALNEIGELIARVPGIDAFERIDLVRTADDRVADADTAAGLRTQAIDLAGTGDLEGAIAKLTEAIGLTDRRGLAPGADFLLLEELDRRAGTAGGDPFAEQERARLAESRERFSRADATRTGGLAPETETAIRDLFDRIAKSGIPDDVAARLLGEPAQTLADGDAAGAIDRLFEALQPLLGSASVSADTLRELLSFNIERADLRADVDSSRDNAEGEFRAATRDLLGAVQDAARALPEASPVFNTVGVASDAATTAFNAGDTEETATILRRLLARIDQAESTSAGRESTFSERELVDALVEASGRSEIAARRDVVQGPEVQSLDAAQLFDLGSTAADAVTDLLEDSGLEEAYTRERNRLEESAKAHVVNTKAVTGERVERRKLLGLLTRTIRETPEVSEAIDTAPLPRLPNIFERLFDGLFSNAVNEKGIVEFQGQLRSGIHGALTTALAAGDFSDFGEGVLFALQKSINDALATNIIEELFEPFLNGIRKFFSEEEAEPVVDPDLIERTIQATPLGQFRDRQATVDVRDQFDAGDITREDAASRLAGINERAVVARRESVTAGFESEETEESAGFLERILGVFGLSTDRFGRATDEFNEGLQTTTDRTEEQTNTFGSAVGSFERAVDKLIGDEPGEGVPPPEIPAGAAAAGGAAAGGAAAGGAAAGGEPSGGGEEGGGILSRILAGFKSFFSAIGSGILGALDSIGLGDVARRVVESFGSLFSGISKGISSLFGGSDGAESGGGFLSGALGAVGGLLGFAEGGVVPGSDGAPRLAIVHGGEWVLNRTQQHDLFLRSLGTGAKAPMVADPAAANAVFAEGQTSMFGNTDKSTHVTTNIKGRLTARERQEVVRDTAAHVAAARRLSRFAA